MTKAEKTAVIEELKVKFSNSSNFYITDTSTLTVEKINQLRGLCFEREVELKVLKNTLIKKALESAPEEKGYADLLDVLKGPTSVMFTEVANSPAKLIKEFRGDNERPILKAAYIDTSVYIGDDQLEALVSLKSKDELLGEIIGLLQSPIKNVLGALQSGGQTISGLVKALEQREG